MKRRSWINARRLDVSLKTLGRLSALRAMRSARALSKREQWELESLEHRLWHLDRGGDARQLSLWENAREVVRS
jgi:hypothetical protein